MTTLDGSIEGWLLLPSPKLDFSKEVENYCELASRKYGTSLRAIIVLNGQNGEFYLAQFTTDDFPAIMLRVMRESHQFPPDFNKALEDPLTYLKNIDSGFKPLGIRGADWNLPDQITVFYYYPKDLVFPEGWNKIPQRILQSTQKNR